MSAPATAFRFIGRGSRTDLLNRINEINPFERTIGHWRPDDEHTPVEDETAPGHPAGYISEPNLVEAVNTALVLGKPLLLTGNPGTGKSELAERLAWELNLGPVLRFEAQSTSEANDLFYRFDLVGQLAANQLMRQDLITQQQASAEKFLSFGPLGKAIIAADPNRYRDLHSRAFAHASQPDPVPRPSVVLIDEIDKTSRDFPNDLLNGIARLSFEIREMNARVKVPEDKALRPIVIITSNSERDLPDPFLRRCNYHHIADPDENLLRKILINRVFGGPQSGSPNERMSTLYEDLLGAFIEMRANTDGRLFYVPGTSELIDWTSSLVHSGADPRLGMRENIGWVNKAVSSVMKHRDDVDVLKQLLLRYQPSTA